MKTPVILALAAVAFAVFFRTDDLIFTVTFFMAGHFGWKYEESPTYMKYLYNRVHSLPKVAATPIPELSIEEFTREKLLKISNNLADPVVIRGALKDSDAVKKWGDSYFQQNYGNETIVVREMIEDVIRFQHRTFEEYMIMKNKGRNVSIVASSKIFYRRNELKRALEAPIESALVGPNNEPILAQQLFMTGGGRSWYHCAVGNNVFRQIAGQKRWNVIDPKKYNLFMCPIPVITATSVTPCLEKLSRDEREEWIEHIPKQTALLNPGDILINSGWWWHDVQSLGQASSPQVSVAGRIKNLKSTFDNSPVLTLNALITKILSRGDEGVDFELALEDGIVESWQRDCKKRGRTDCITPP